MAVLTIQPDETASVDCYARDSNSSTAYNDNFLKLGAGSGKASGVYRSMLEFDASALPTDAYVTGVEFSIKVSQSISAGDGSARLYQTVDEFDETSSWLYRTGTTPWTNPDGTTATEPTYSSAQGSVAFTMNATYTYLTLSGSDLVSMMEHARKFQAGKLRLMMKLDDDTTESGVKYMRFHSSNNGTSTNRPKLEITYQTTSTIAWTGAAGDGNLATAGNWAGGVAPAQYDIAHFSADAPAATTGTLTCYRMHTTKDYGSDLGTASTAITVNCEQATLERENGRTNINFNPSSGSTESVRVLRTPRASGMTTIGGNITTLYVSESRGTLNVRDSATVGTAYVCPGSASAARVSFGSGINAALIATRGAEIESASGLGDIYLSGRSSLEITTESGDTASGSTFISNSTLKHSGVTTAGGTVNLYSGVYDLSQSVAGQHTIANLNTYSGTLNARNGLGSFDAATVAGSWNHYGGIIIMDAGTTLTI